MSSDFDKIVAGLEMDVEGAEREQAVLDTGISIFKELAHVGLADDPVMVFLVTAYVFGSHFMRMPLTFLDDDAMGKIYATLAEMQ